jgi:hypothetical protein
MESVALPDQVALGLLEVTCMIGACLVVMESAVAVPVVSVGVPQILETWEEKLKTVSEILAMVIPVVCLQVLGL